MYMKVKVKSLSHVRLSATPWTATVQVPPSMGFSRQGYWSGVLLITKLDSCMIFINLYKIFLKTHVLINSTKFVLYIKTPLSVILLTPEHSLYF